MDESEESKLEKLSIELEKVIALISEKKPKEAVGIVSNVLKSIKAGLETANPQYKQLYDVKIIPFSLAQILEITRTSTHASQIYKGSLPTQ